MIIDWFFKRVFPVFFIGMFVVVMAVIAYLAYQCYAGGDPNSMACYMISDRMEIGVRQR